jgi:hypothetical protein
MPGYSLHIQGTRKHSRQFWVIPARSPAWAGRATESFLHQTSFFWSNPVCGTERVLLSPFASEAWSNNIIGNNSLSTRSSHSLHDVPSDHGKFCAEHISAWSHLANLLRSGDSIAGLFKHFSHQYPRRSAAIETLFGALHFPHAPSNSSLMALPLFGATLGCSSLV